jgi:hypothetical protein
MPHIAPRFRKPQPPAAEGDHVWDVPVYWFAPKCAAHTCSVSPEEDNKRRVALKSESTSRNHEDSVTCVIAQTRVTEVDGRLIFRVPAFLLDSAEIDQWVRSIVNTFVQSHSGNSKRRTVQKRSL